MRLEPTTRRLAAYALALLAGCQPKAIPMTLEEAQRVDRITDNVTTRCVGKYLVDMPAQFVLNSQWSAEIGDIKVDMRPQDKRAFERSLASRKLELETERIDGEGVLSLAEVRQLPKNAGLAFNRSRNRGSAALRTWEILAWIDGYQVVATIDARDMTNVRRLNEGDTRRTDTEEKYRQLVDLFSRLRGRAETEVPKVQGFCIANGFVVGPPGDSENVSIAFHLDGAPDVFFNVSEPGENIKERERLLERSAKVEAEMKLSGTQTIRKGVVKHGGMEFDEWLFKGPTHDRVPGTMFVQVGNESKPGRQFPFVRLELFNGFRIPAPERTPEESAQLQELKRATLSEAEAIAVWDKVAPTLRLRPGAL